SVPRNSGKRQPGDWFGTAVVSVWLGNGSRSAKTARNTSTASQVPVTQTKSPAFRSLRRPGILRRRSRPRDFRSGLGSPGMGSSVCAEVMFGSAFFTVMALLHLYAGVDDTVGEVDKGVDDHVDRGDKHHYALNSGYVLGRDGNNGHVA